MFKPEITTTIVLLHGGFAVLLDAAFLSPWFHSKMMDTDPQLLSHNMLLAIMLIRYAGTWSDKIKEQEDKKRKMIAASNQVQPSPNIFGDFTFLRLPSEWKKSAWVIVTLWILLIGTAIYLQT